MSSTAAAEEIHGVTTIELFFDLVFVFTITQLTQVLIDDMSALGLLRVCVAFVVLWWMYTAYAWLTNTLSPTTDLRRLLLIASMGGFLLVALATPTAAGDGGVLWGVGYLLVVLVHAGLFTQVNRRILRVLPVNALGAVLIIVAGLIDHGPWPYVLWIMAMLIPIVVAFGLRGHEGFPIKPGHIVERHGLAVMITFGESIIAIGIGIGAAGTKVDAGLAVAALLGLGLVAALWWTYFSGDDERTEHSLAAAGEEQRTLMTLYGYFFAHIPIVIGIIALAAGLKKAVAHPYDALSIGPAVALAGGTALYLLGNVFFRHIMRIGPSKIRLATAVLVLAAIPLARGSAVAGVAVLVAIVVGALALERRGSPEHRSDLGQSMV